MTLLTFKEKLTLEKLISYEHNNNKKKTKC